MADPDKPLDEETLKETAFGNDESRPLTDSERVFIRMVCDLMFHHIQLLAFKKEEELADLDNYLNDTPNQPTTMGDYSDEYDDLGIDTETRGGDTISIDRKTSEGLWHMIQILDDPGGDHDRRFEADIGSAASSEYDEVRLVSL